MKIGVLLVSFGSSYKETREKNIEKMAKFLQNKIGVEKIYQAYTSDIIRKILKDRDGIEVMDVSEALESMKSDGVEKVYIQPTHIIDGIENNKMYSIAESYKNEFESIKIGAHLLDSDEDYNKVALGLWDEMKDIVKDDILLLMGHGSEHQANDSYLKLQQCFIDNGISNVFIFTVEGSPLIDDIIKDVESQNKKKVTLLPFMFVAGDHAINDMAGDDEDSVASLLKERGYKVNSLIKGLGEFEFIRDLYLEHLNKAMK